MYDNTGTGQGGVEEGTEAYLIPLRRMPFEQRGFRCHDDRTATYYPSSGVADGGIKSHSRVVREWLKKLDEEQAARADAARICDCGAANAHDDHADTCWARPLRIMPFEQPRFRASGPLPFKLIDAPATKWFPSAWVSVLPAKHSLFRETAGAE
jgi:hypothetical protein